MTWSMERARERLTELEYVDRPVELVVRQIAAAMVEQADSIDFVGQQMVAPIGRGRDVRAFVPAGRAELVRLVVEEQLREQLEPAAPAAAPASGFSWAYRCSACNELVTVEAVQAHVVGHRERKDYDGGHIQLTRVD